MEAIQNVICSPIRFSAIHFCENSFFVNHCTKKRESKITGIEAPAGLRLHQRAKQVRQCCDLCFSSLRMLALRKGSSSRDNSVGSLAAFGGSPRSYGSHFGNHWARLW